MRHVIDIDPKDWPQLFKYIIIRRIAVTRRGSDYNYSTNKCKLDIFSRVAIGYASAN